jgi:hypothetical protein
MTAVGDSKGVIGKTDSEDRRFDSGDETANSSIEHPFSDPEVADRWRKVYENAQYENRHRFDPNFTWTAQEEKKLVRKVRCSSGRDLHYYLFMALLVFLKSVD